MKNCKIYVGGQEVGQLQDLNCDISAPEDYHTPYDFEKMENIYLPFLHILPERMTYKQYHNSIVFLIHCDDYKQAKTHHKGRINKKWAKRYGYVLTKEAAER